MSAIGRAVSGWRVPVWLRKALGLAPEGPHYAFYRHKLVVRLTHWANAGILFVMLMSGLADLQRPSRALSGATAPISIIPSSR